MSFLIGYGGELILTFGDLEARGSGRVRDNLYLPATRLFVQFAMLRFESAREA